MDESMDTWSEWFPTPSLRWCFPADGGEKVLEQRFERSRTIDGIVTSYETEEEWREIENVVQ